MTSDSEEKKLATVRAYVESELKSSWDRKTSFETRAFAAISLNAALVALFLSVSKKDALDFNLNTSTTRWTLIVAVALSVLSILLAVAGAFPLNYPSLEPLLIESTRQEASNEAASPSDIESKLLDAKILQLVDNRSSNRIKGKLVRGAFYLFGGAATCYVLAFAASLFC